MSGADLPLNAPQQAPDTRPLEAVLTDIAGRLSARGWMLATAESCTGGLIAAACTDLAGSSQWFERGFVTYSNAAKTELLAVPAALIDAHASGATDGGDAIWSLMNLELWYRTFIDGEGIQTLHSPTSLAQATPQVFRATA